MLDRYDFDILSSYRKARCVRLRELYVFRSFLILEVFDCFLNRDLFEFLSDSDDVVSYCLGYNFDILFFSSYEVVEDSEEFVLALRYGVFYFLLIFFHFFGFSVFKSKEEMVGIFFSF